MGIRLRPLEVFSFVYPGNKLLLTAKTLKNKKVIKLGLLVLWRKDNAPLASSTNLELSKFLLRKRRVNFGKKKKKKKNNHETITFVPTKKKISILKTYWLFVVSVKKQTKPNIQIYMIRLKFEHTTIIPFIYIQVFFASLLKIMF